MSVQNRLQIYNNKLPVNKSTIKAHTLPLNGRKKSPPLSLPFFSLSAFRQRTDPCGTSFQLTEFGFRLPQLTRMIQ